LGTDIHVSKELSMSAAHFDDRGWIATCPACNQKNRVPYEHLGKTGQCGNCKRDLLPPSAAMEMDSEAHFDRVIGDAALPVVVDYWAPWCGPCRQVGPEMEKVAATGAGKILVVKVNTEALPSLGRRFQIQSIPALAVFVDGREAARTVGARPAAAIQEFIREALGPA
jgi:thioredoxin 2